MGRKYDSAAIDPKWREARSRARYIADIDFIAYFDMRPRRLRKLRQLEERRWFLAAFYKEASQ